MIRPSGQNRSAAFISTWNLVSARRAARSQADASESAEPGGAPAVRGRGSYPDDFGFSPAERTDTTLLSMSNQNGAPSEAAPAVTSNPITFESQSQ